MPQDGAPSSIDVLAAQVRAELRYRAENLAPRDSVRLHVPVKRSDLIALLDECDVLVARVTEATVARDFWKQRYDIQHGTVHRMEDTIAELRSDRADARNALEAIANGKNDIRSVGYRAGEAGCRQIARAVLARLDGNQE